MKKLLLLTALAISNLLMAKTITVDNTPLGTAMYTNLQTAIDSADAGDILLIKGGGATYGNITINKQLTLIGEGYKKQGRISKTELGSVNFSNVNCTGSVFQSLKMGNFFNTSSSNGKIDKVRLENVSLSNLTLFGLDWYLLKCEISASSTVGKYRGDFENCLIRERINGNNEATLPSTFTNCVFLYIIGGTTAKKISNSRFTNCIFNYTGQIGNGATTNNVFQNCFFNSDSEQNLRNDGNVISNSIFKEQPQFVDAVDYQLSTASPAKGAGKDGTDIGMTGGQYPVTALNGENNLPQVTSFFVETGVITPGQPLKLKFSAKKKSSK